MCDLDWKPSFDPNPYVFSTFFILFQCFPICVVIFATGLIAFFSYPYQTSTKFDLNTPSECSFPKNKSGNCNGLDPRFRQSFSFIGVQPFSLIRCFSFSCRTRCRLKIFTHDTRIKLSSLMDIDLQSWFLFLWSYSYRETLFEESSLTSWDYSDRSWNFVVTKSWEGMIYPRSLSNHISKLIQTRFSCIVKRFGIKKYDVCLVCH